MTSIQIKYFVPLIAGGVAHKVTLPSYTGCFSCRFTAEGKLVDAEHHRPNGKVYPVREGQPAWQGLSRLFPAILKK